MQYFFSLSKKDTPQENKPIKQNTTNYNVNYRLSTTLPHYISIDIKTSQCCGGYIYNDTRPFYRGSSPRQERRRIATKQSFRTTVNILKLVYYKRRRQKTDDCNLELKAKAGVLLQNNLQSNN